ncbi:hypothetical protein DL93DRAFT_2168297 [Clavulina sp. PMI_390]|nr:hypothetical protein DL93DRAFT_2168297 [Clavulina sp. PMI_390]
MADYFGVDMPAPLDEAYVDRATARTIARLLHEDVHGKPLPLEMTSDSADYTPEDAVAIARILEEDAHAGLISESGEGFASGSGILTPTNERQTGQAYNFKHDGGAQSQETTSSASAQGLLNSTFSENEPDLRWQATLRYATVGVPEDDWVLISSQDLEKEYNESEDTRSHTQSTSSDADNVSRPTNESFPTETRASPIPIYHNPRGPRPRHGQSNLSLQRPRPAPGAPHQHQASEPETHPPHTPDSVRANHPLLPLPENRSGRLRFALPVDRDPSLHTHGQSQAMAAFFDES